MSFTPLLGKYVTAKPIHPTQQLIEESETAWIFQLKLIPNRDLMMHLRSYGSEMKILKPFSLVTAFTRDVEATLVRYKR